MPNFLQNIGRSTLADNVAGLVRTKLMMDQGERADRESNMRQAIEGEQLERIKRINTNEKAAAERGGQPIAIESISNLVAGGPDGPVFKFLYDYADQQGLIDKSHGGLGAITRNGFSELQNNIVNNPLVGQKVAGISMDYYRTQIKQADEMLAKKPDDQNALSMRQQAATSLDAMIAYNKGLNKYFSGQKEKTAEDKDPAALRTFEAVHYGKPVPELRGTPEYVKAFEKSQERQAIRIGLQEKVDTAEALKDVDIRAHIKTPAWDKQIADVARSKFDKDMWDDMPKWRRDKEIFDTANSDIKTAYSDWNPYFGEKNGVEGWYGKNPKTGKFEAIKRWGAEKGAFKEPPKKQEVWTDTTPEGNPIVRGKLP
jgi:hypothetical protein